MKTTNLKNKGPFVHPYYSKIQCMCGELLDYVEAESIEYVQEHHTGYAQHATSRGNLVSQGIAINGFTVIVRRCYACPAGIKTS
jgi:hypothetical protein